MTAANPQELRPSRNRAAVWRTVTLAALAALAALLMFGSHEPPLRDPWHQTRSRLLDAGHLPFFLVGVVGWYLLFPLWRDRRWLRLALAVCLALGAAIGIELLQPGFGRSASVQDLVNGVLGVLGGTALLLAARLGTPRQRAVALGSAVLLVLLCSLYVLQPARHAYRAARSRATHFPVLLANFADEEPLWIGQEGPVLDAPLAPRLTRLDPRPAGADHDAIACSPADGDHPGVVYLAGDADWRSYRVLHLQLRNADTAPRDLYLRLDDLQYRPIRGLVRAQYHVVLALPPGDSTHDIALTALGDRARGDAPRPDLSGVRRLVLFHPRHFPALSIREARLRD